MNNETGGRDVEVDWENPDILYAAMYKGFRKGWDIISGGPASEGGIYKSTDGGETWKHITNGLPKDLIGKIDIDIARSNPRVLYAMVEAPRRPGRAVSARTTPARSWTLVNNSQRLRARPFYFHYVDVNPKNENEVWVNELGLQKSDRRRQDVHRRSTRRTATTTACGSTPTTRTSSCRSTTAAPTSA